MKPSSVAVCAQNQRYARAHGHRVITVGRRDADGEDAIAGDFTSDLNAATWVPRLAGVDVVVNAVGIIHEHGKQTFESVHIRAPLALFAACVDAGVQKVVQISALGADRGTTGYFTSKHAADQYLSSLTTRWTIVQPSLMFGASGARATLFTLLASLPHFY